MINFKSPGPPVWALWRNRLDWSVFFDNYFWDDMVFHNFCAIKTIIYICRFLCFICKSFTGFFAVSAAFPAFPAPFSRSGWKTSKSSITSIQGTILFLLCFKYNVEYKYCRYPLTEIRNDHWPGVPSVGTNWRQFTFPGPRPRSPLLFSSASLVHLVSSSFPGCCSNILD